MAIRSETNTTLKDIVLLLERLDLRVKFPERVVKSLKVPVDRLKLALDILTFCWDGVT